MATSATPEELGRLMRYVIGRFDGPQDAIIALSHVLGWVIARGAQEGRVEALTESAIAEVRSAAARAVAYIATHDMDAPPPRSPLQ